jgi:hypothetical protein
VGHERHPLQQTAACRFPLYPVNDRVWSGAIGRDGPRAAVSTCNNAHQQEQKKTRLFELVSLCRLEHDVPWVNGIAMIVEELFFIRTIAEQRITDR